MVHGDIKPSNILATSFNWLFLTDLVPYKPAYLGEDDLKQYNLYFGELDNNKRCYLAPERFLADYSDEFFNNSLLEPSMDVFSAGCVIAEIFMDGHPLFDLANLQNYRKRIYDPREDLTKKIKDK
jgi:phosphoinositide-3-kinase regulatory subunit 4